MQFPPVIAPPESVNVKRYRMTLDLRVAPLPHVVFPTESRAVRWSPNLRDTHAKLQHLSFRHEYDATLFPSFNDYERCVRLIDSLASSVYFDQNATQILAFHSTHENRTQWLAAATIQVMRYTPEIGSIVNVAVLPSYRRRGVGRAILASSLSALKLDGVEQVILDVTATNVAAIALYHQHGFQITETTYKEIAIF